MKVRTILDKKSGTIQPWAALQTAAYELLDAPVTFAAEGHQYTHNGLPLPSVTGILKAEGFIDTAFFDDWSRDRGSMVHLATAYDDAGELDEDTIDPAIAPYIEAWRKFRRESGFVTEASEVSLRSTLYRFAGTIDTIGHFPGRSISRAAVELHNDGTYKLIPFTDRQDKQIFLAALACHNWKQNHRKGKS